MITHISETSCSVILTSGEFQQASLSIPGRRIPGACSIDNAHSRQVIFIIISLFCSKSVVYFRRSLNFVIVLSSTQRCSNFGESSSTVTMITLLSPNYVPHATSRSDLAIASIAFGWTLGFGWLTTWSAYKQTSRVRQRYGITRVHTPYVVMIWSEIFVCMSFAVICWLHVFELIPPRYSSHHP